jgi:hypothetical protein
MIRCAVAYVRDSFPRHRPWLVLGKGPSLARLKPQDALQYSVMTLNHACLVARPDVASFVDWEACADCFPRLADASSYHGRPIAVCLPWHPHVRCRPTDQTLDQFQPAVAGLDRGSAWLSAGIQGRLLAYNSTTAGRLPRHPHLATVRVRHFGAVAAFNLLAKAGVREVASLGVDGGTEYDPRFDPKDRLANGHRTFDAQFAEINRTVKANKMTWRRL